MPNLTSLGNKIDTQRKLELHPKMHLMSTFTGLFPWQVPVASLPFRQPVLLCLVGKISSHFERVTVFIASQAIIHSFPELGSMSSALSLLLLRYHMRVIARMLVLISGHLSGHSVPLCEGGLRDSCSVSDSYMHSSLAIHPQITRSCRPSGFPSFFMMFILLVSVYMSDC